jgi:hypothetical protein
LLELLISPAEKPQNRLDSQDLKPKGRGTGAQHEIHKNSSGIQNRKKQQKVKDGSALDVNRTQAGFTLAVEREKGSGG